MAKMTNLLLFLLFISLISCKSADAIAECARAQLGKTYKAGASGPNNFDNSGLISYCHRETDEEAAESANSPLTKGRPGDGSTGDVIYIDVPNKCSPCQGIVVGSGYAVTVYANGVVEYISYYNNPYYEGKIRRFTRSWTSSSFGASNSLDDQTGINIFNLTYYKKKYRELNIMNDYQITEHWYTVGRKEGRSPCIYYDPVFYLNNNPDIKNIIGEDYTKLYTQFVEGGMNEYRYSSPVYSGSYYRDHNIDLRTLRSPQLIEHFMTKGMKEGRQSSERFDVIQYMNHYKDLEAMYGNDYEKYYYNYMTNCGKDC